MVRILHFDTVALFTDMTTQVLKMNQSDEICNDNSDSRDLLEFEDAENIFIMIALLL